MKLCCALSLAERGRRLQYPDVLCLNVGTPRKPSRP